MPDAVLPYSATSALQPPDSRGYMGAATRPASAPGRRPAQARLPAGEAVRTYGRMPTRLQAQTVQLHEDVDVLHGRLREVRGMAIDAANAPPGSWLRRALENGAGRRSSRCQRRAFACPCGRESR